VGSAHQASTGHQHPPRKLREARPFRRQRTGFLLQRTTAALTEIVVFEIDVLWRRGKASRNGRHQCLGTPKNVGSTRSIALHLAKSASTPGQRDHFAKLARTWIKLAEELEQTEAFLAAIEDEEPTKKAG
jgi:hypothetical protein